MQNLNPLVDSETHIWSLTGESSDVANFTDAIPIQTTPFRIGRKNGLDLTLKSPIVSSFHASIFEDNKRLFVEDFQSLNGTFVNGEKVQTVTPLSDGDLIQFAHSVFRINRSEINPESIFGMTACPNLIDEAGLVIEFENLMSDRLIVPHFQSIVDLSTNEVMGFESLARGTTENLRSPKDMIRAATKMQRESDWSQLQRLVAAQHFELLSNRMGAEGKSIFLNTHPGEIQQPSELLYSLQSLRRRHPAINIVLEIHESMVTSVAQMGELFSALADLDIETAYDDFGAGQARFFELIEEPPKYLKFDIRLVKGLHNASDRKVNTVSHLVELVKNLGILSLAEGIENEQDAAVCAELGFDLGQGFYFSPPKPMADMVKEHNNPFATQKNFQV